MVCFWHNKIKERILFKWYRVFGCEKYSQIIQINLNKLKSTNSCSGCDLTGVELVGWNLKNANLSGFANLSRADLTNANLTDANLTAAGLTGANLEGANLKGAILTDGQSNLLESWSYENPSE